MLTFCPAGSHFRDALWERGFLVDFMTSRSSPRSSKMSTNEEHESGKALSYIPLTAIEKDPRVSDRYKNKVRKNLENSVDNIHRNPCFEVSEIKDSANF